MKIEIEDIKFWMDAIRNSEDRDRTLESFWGGQLLSKNWLIENLEKIVTKITNANIVIHGGWNGVLSSMLFNSNIGIQNIVSVDIDPRVKDTAITINKRYEIEGRFKAVVSDMCKYDYNERADIVINTSCEHITNEQYNQWLDKIPKNSLIVLQSNNYFDLDEHINCHDTLKSFEESSKINIVYSNQLELPHVNYKRFMLIGNKDGR